MNSAIAGTQRVVRKRTRSSPPRRPGPRARGAEACSAWIPAFAGMTEANCEAIAARSIHPCFGGKYLYLVRQSKEMNRAVAELDAAVAVEPGERVLHPVPVVAFRVILAGMRAATLGPVFGGVQRDNGLLEQILQLQRLDQVGVPDHRPVGDAELAKAVGHHVDPADPLPQHLRGPEHGAVVLHHALHVEPDLGGFARAV